MQSDNSILLVSKWYKAHQKYMVDLYFCDKENIIKTSPRSPPNQGARQSHGMVQNSKFPYRQCTTCMEYKDEKNTWIVYILHAPSHKAFYLMGLRA